jgi:uncharacterized protein YbaP (TraB family)
MNSRARISDQVATGSSAKAERVAHLCALALSTLLALVAGPAPAAAEAGAPADPLFAWRVHGPGPAEVTILGSVAVRDTAMLRFDPALMEAFRRSDRLVLPNDAVKGEQFSLIGNRARLAEDEKIADRLAPPLYARLRAALERSGLPPGTADGIAPWFAAWILRGSDLLRAHYADELEFDLYFVALAHNRKPVVYLEPSGVSYDRLVALSPEVQSRLLEAALEASDRALETIPRIEHDWRRGGAEDMARAISAVPARHPELRPAYEQTLFRDSARLAAAVVSQLDQGGRAFVVAHARNLVGDAGVLALLASRGLEIEQLGAQSRSGEL